MSSPNFKLKSPMRRSRRPLIALLILAIALALGLGSYMFIQNRDSENAQIEQKARDEAQNGSAKKDLQDKDRNDDNTKSKNLPDNSISTTTDKIPASEELSTAITSVSQKDGSVYSEAITTGATAEGTCVFTYTTPDERPVLEQVTSSGKICKSSIPEVQFSKLGTWNLQVLFYLNNVKSEANKNVSIN